MKLLHTADLHLGKTLHETSLLDVQAKMLDSLLDILTQQPYAALLIAGDVYDRAIPSAEAVSLFSGFLARIRDACPETAVFIIPGNHDSAQRLAFAHEILQNQHIYIAQDMSQLAKPVIITQGGEQLAVFLLPFLSFGSFSQDIQEQYGRTGDSQADMAAIAADILKQARPSDMPSLLMAHLFTVGGQSSASERTFIGTAEYINPSLFAFFDYVALGHLHRCQRVTDTMYYSGSPLPYSFDESDDEKCVLAVDIDCSAPADGHGGSAYPVTVEQIPLRSERPLKRLEGSFAEFFTGRAFDEWNSCYLEITLTDSEVIAHPMQLLRQKFPFLLSIRQKSFMDTARNPETDQLTIRENEADDPQTLTDNFNRFETVINGEPNQIKQELFELLCKETSYET
jgi:exonuclease SbcD